MITPDWPAPANVHALITERQGGVSAGPFASFNMAGHVGDDASAVLENRKRLHALTGVREWQWLDQVHGTAVVSAMRQNSMLVADGSYTAESQLGLAVLTADCLPLLLCNKSGTQVAAVHAGWRGLSAGIVANAVDRFDCPAEDILVYLGPAISALAFEVGPEVREVFLALGEHYGQDWQGAFAPSASPNHFFADLYQLARRQLSALGVQQVYGGIGCTFSEKERFYSFRRDGETGRMASVIWLD